MKSKLFGFGAKMALAAVAVCGMLTSCYEKEEIDNTGSTQLPDPAYVLYGNVTNARYLKATRTVYMQTVKAGETCIVVADIALYDASSQAVDVEVNAPATSDQAKKILEEAKGEMTKLLSAVEGIDAESLTFTVEEDGSTTVNATAAVSEQPVGQSVKVAVPSFTGFASTITPESTLTKALTDAQIWVASAEKALNKSYGLKTITVEKELPGLVGQSIVGYSLTIKMENRVLQFNGYEGYVTYQLTAVVAAKYQSHDSHDSHDGHGTNPGAGGGAGESI